MADRAAGAGDPGRRSSVKAGLTSNRRRRRVENDEYASFIRRVIRAHARRVAVGDVDALADMTGLATELDEAIAQAVIGLPEAGYNRPELPCENFLHDHQGRTFGAPSLTAWTLIFPGKDLVPIGEDGEERAPPQTLGPSWMKVISQSQFRFG